MDTEPTWELRVRGDKEENIATVYTREHQFSVGEPMSFDREYGHVTALEQMLGALAGDVVNGFRRQAEQERLELGEVEATINARLNNPLTYLGVVGEQGDPGLETVSIKVYASTMEPEDDVREAWELARKRSPLIQTFQGTIEFNLMLELTL